MSRFSRRLQAASRNAPAGNGPNLLIGKVFTATVGDSTSEPGNPIAHATDQDDLTRWISQPTSPMNMTADLGGVYDLSRVRVVWAADTIKNYTLAVSTNNSTWTTIATGITDNSLKQTVDYTSFSGTPKGRYLRITATDRWNTSYGNSVWEVEAYGTLDTSFPTGSIAPFNATAVSDTAINLTWGYSGSPLTNYTLKRGGTTIASPAAGATSYSDTGLTAGTPYSYSLTGNYTVGGTTNTATANATTTGGSSRHVAYYVNKWNSPSLATCFSHGITHAYAFVAQSAGSGTGLLSYSPYEGDAAFIAAKQAAGKKVYLTLGGANDGGIALTSSTHVSQMVSSVKGIVDRLGLDGIDWDLESSSYTVANLVDVSQQLAAYYGSGFRITFVPRPWETPPFQAAQQIQQAGILEFFGLQFYDSPEYSNYAQGWPAISSYLNKSISTYGIPANKVLMGVIGPNYPNGGMSYSLMLQYWNSALATWPTLGGMFFYDGPIDQNDGWGWANNVLPVVLSS